MIGFPVRVIAISWMNLRAEDVAYGEAPTGAASRGSAVEQHLCIADVAQRRKEREDFERSGELD
jgi:hypothetical protein